MMISAQPVATVNDGDTPRPPRGVCVAIIANIQDVGVVARQLALEILDIYEAEIK